MWAINSTMLEFEDEEEPDAVTLLSVLLVGKKVSLSSFTIPFRGEVKTTFKWKTFFFVFT